MSVTVVVPWPRYPVTTPGGKPSICSASGCARHVKARGLCKKHYESGRKDGSLPLLVIAPVADRLLAGLDRSGDCWLWTKNVTSAGYDSIRDNGKATLVHRVAYQLWVGPIPDGYTIDHTCHNVDPSCEAGDNCRHRRCCNPSHLEAVVISMNILRGKSISAIGARQTHCKNGHPFDEENTYTYVGKNGRSPHRMCKTCRRDGKVRRRQVEAMA